MTWRTPEPGEPDSEGVIAYISQAGFTFKMVEAPAVGEFSMELVPTQGLADVAYVLAVNPGTIEQLKEAGTFEAWLEYVTKALLLLITTQHN